MNRNKQKQLAMRLLVFSTFLLTCLNVFAAQTLIKNATIVPLSDSSKSTFFTGYILFDQESIISMGEGAPENEVEAQADTVIDATSKIVMPGFVSGHNHLWQSAFRGLASDKELYGWLEALHWTYGDYFSDGDFYTFTKHGALDQLSKGITTTYNHSQRLGGTESQYLESFQASLDVNQHFIFSYNANMNQPNKKVQSDFSAFYKLAKPHKAKGSLLDISVHSVGAYFGEDKLKLEMDIAKKYGLTAQIHYLEEHQRRFVDRKKWPMFLRAGAVADHVSFAHFIHTTDKIINDSALSGVSMIWNPLSNGRLASGLANIPKYLEHGIKVGMGVDGAASADIADPFENMRMGMYALRMQEHNANAMTPLHILKLHTIRTSEVLKVNHLVGSLEPGKLADILIIDPAKPGTGAVFDPLATLVFASSSANIESIYVRGKLSVLHGVPVNQDMTALQLELQERIENIVKRASAQN